MAKKPSQTDLLSTQEKKAALEAALKGGMDPAEVFAAVLQNVYGIEARKKLVLEWGKRMGLEPSDSLRIAQSANLIPTARPPRTSQQEKPPRKSLGKSGE
jgi:hypothetical protein